MVEHHFDNLQKQPSYGSEENNNPFSDLLNDLYDKRNAAAPRASEWPSLKPGNNGDLDRSIDQLLRRFKEENGEQIEQVAPLTDKQVQDYAKRISDIISKNDDFSYGGKNDRIREMFSQAAAGGEKSFNLLLDAVNKQLAEKGLKMKGSYAVATTEDLKDLGNIALQSYPPIYPNARFTQTKTAHVELTLNSKNGEEDRLRLDRTLSQQIIRKSYRPSLRDESEISYPLKEIMNSLDLNK